MYNAKPARTCAECALGCADLGGHRAGLRIGAYLSSLCIGVRILDCLLRLRVGLRLCLRCAAAVVVGVPCKHGVKAEAACGATQPKITLQSSQYFCEDQPLSQVPLLGSESNIRLRILSLGSQRYSHTAYSAVRAQGCCWLLKRQYTQPW